MRPLTQTSTRDNSVREKANCAATLKNESQYCGMPFRPSFFILCALEKTIKTFISKLEKGNWNDLCLELKWRN